MSKNNISITNRFHVLIRLLNNNESFDIACSKSGLTIKDAKKILDKNDLTKQLHSI